MLGRLKKKLKSEDGAVQIVEAAFVFPIMFIILFFLIYVGNAYYVRSQVDAIVAEKAISGASYCVDPMLQTIKETGHVPSLDDADHDPYRYLFGMSGVEEKINREVVEAIKSSSVSLFRNMEPKLVTKESDISKYTNYVLYSTFSVEVKCVIEFPISFFGDITPKMMTILSRAEIAVNDTSDFIRNTDMVIDYFEDTKFGQSIKTVFDKINDFIKTFAGNEDE